MENITSVLSREVERLVTAPYAPSLQDLFGISQSLSNSHLRLWASHKPCQVGPLVDIFVDSLPRSSVALRLFEVFTRLPSFRDALLQRYPYLLDQFLQRSIEEGEVEYISTCISILSSPLPTSLVAPARLAPFFTRLICVMGNNPCAETILPLYQLISGLQGSPRVLFEVPQETMSSLQVELTKTLRNLNDHMGNLLCLSIFAKIASSWKNAQYRQSQAIPIWLQNINHFFGPKRGMKTLDLVVLRVILACSASCNNLTADQAAEGIRLAVVICDNLEEEQRKAWISANAPKIAKLCEKVTRSGINPEVQILGVTFLMTLLPSTSLSLGVTGTALQWLLSKDSGRIMEALSLDLISFVTETTVICLGQPAINNLLKHVLASLRIGSPSSISRFTRIQLASAVFSGLQGLDSTFAENSYQQCIDTMLELMETFPRSPQQSQCQGSSVCHASLSRLEDELLYDIFERFLRTSLWKGTGPDTLCTGEFRIFNTIMARAKSSMLKPACSFLEVQPLQLRESFASLKILGDAPYQRRDWRSGLEETLLLNAQSSHDSMIRKVEEICYELERRCKDVETPLRAAEEDHERVSKEAEEWKNLSDELRTQLQQATDTISRLQENTTSLETHAETSSARVEELLQSLDLARKELEELRRDSQEAANAEREKARTRELDFIASITEKEDRLEGLQEDLRGNTEKNVELQQSLKAAMEEKTRLHEEIRLMSQELSRLQQCLEQVQSQSSLKDEEIQRALSAKEDMEARAEILQNKLNEEVTQTDSLRSGFSKAEAAFKAEVAAIRERLESQISEAEKECAQQKEEGSSLRHAMQVAESSAEKKLQTKENRVQYLEKKVQHMRNERAAKAREFSEAQQHIGRLMNVMGFKPDPVNPKSSIKQPQSPRSPHLSTPRKQTRSEGYPRSQSEDLLDLSFTSDVSLSGKRSPKRSRDNAFPLADVPPSSQAPERRRSRSSKMGQQRERKALEDTDQNSQPNSQGTSKSGLSQRESLPESQFYGNLDENHLQDIDLDMDLEFSKDFLFTSTSMSQAKTAASSEPRH